MDYSQDDFLKMQQQAIERVKQMQKQSAQTMTEKADEKDQKQEKQKPPSTRPPEIRKSKARPQSKPKTASPLSSLFHLDSDTAMILPLLILLGREGTDDILLLALLYIMTGD